MTGMISYLQLCRSDVALIAFFSYLVGAKLAGGTDLYDVIIALAVTLISTNFIYSFNSWTDWEIDRVSKAYRPIPGGKIKPAQALIYSLVLLILSIVYPLFVYKSYVTLSLFLLLPALGLLYSARPIRLRRYPFSATVTISMGLITPIMLGYFMNTSDTCLIPFFVVLFLFCLSVVPLKKIEEVDEDERRGCRNLYSRFGIMILIWPLGGLSLVLLLLFFWTTGYLLKTCLLVITISSMVCILVFGVFREKLYQLYQTIIYIVIVEGVIFYLILMLINS
ncbi:UbiA family prenyltransferase [bacterium]|nr:UbiA family prenyltransferase [bacterium]